MAEEYLLGADIGTTRLKVLLFCADGRLIASAESGYSGIRSGKTSEQQPEDWWRAFVKAVREVLRAFPDENCRERVAAIALSTQGGTLVPVDSEFRPVRPAIVWEDSRCSEEAEEWVREGMKEYLFETTGWPLTNSLNALQILRMKRREPERFARTAYFLSVPDYFSVRMTGNAALDVSNGGINQLADIRRGRWDTRILDALGIREEQLGKLVESGERIGTLTPEAARELGLSESCVVAAGGHDQYCAALGAGAIHRGDVFISAGTAWTAARITDSPVDGYSRSRHTVPGLWGSLLSQKAGGSCFEWFRNQLRLFGEKEAEFDALNRKLETVETGELMFYPFFFGSTFPEEVPDARAAFRGLSYHHDLYHIGKAVMEGVCAQTAWMLEALEAQNSERLYMVGGATYSRVWTQIMANMAGIPITIPEYSEAGCVGAAVLAGIAAGIYRDAGQGVDRMCRQNTVIYPDKERESCRAKLEQYKRGYAGFYSGERK